MAPKKSETMNSSIYACVHAIQVCLNLSLQTCPGVISVPRSTGHRADVLQHHRLVRKYQILFAERNRVEQVEEIVGVALVSEVQAQH